MNARIDPSGKMETSGAQIEVGGMKDAYLYVEIALEKQILEFPKINAMR